MGPRDKPEGDNWSGLARHPAAWICGVRRLYAPAGVLFPEGAVTGMQGRSITLFELLGFKVRRSEEHTSELQSLMRISYAVFCLKKKNHKYNQETVHTNTKIINQ